MPPGPGGQPHWKARSAISASSSRRSGRPLPVTAAYHDACHLAHAQGVTSQPRDLLLAIPGLTLAEIADGGTCCGSAGIYNLVQPEAARELGERKARAVLRPSRSRPPGTS